MVLILVLAAPAFCWALAATDLRSRLIGCSVLAGSAAGQWMLALGWFGHELQLTGIALLTLFVILMLATAPAVLPDAIVTSRITKARIVIGYVLGFGYSVLCGIVLLGTSAILLMMGRYSWMPPADALGSLPDGLSVIETVEMGCTNRSSDSSCDRKFIIGAEGRTPEETAERIRRHLHDAEGWSFTPATLTSAERDYWKGACRMEGWALDRHDTCMRVYISDNQVVVWLSYEDDC